MCSNGVHSRREAVHDVPHEDLILSKKRRKIRKKKRKMSETIPSFELIASYSVSVSRKVSVLSEGGDLIGVNPSAEVSVDTFWNY